MVNLDTMPPKAKGGGCRQRAARATAAGEARVAAATVGGHLHPKANCVSSSGRYILVRHIISSTCATIATAADTDVYQLDTYNKSRYI